MMKRRLWFQSLENRRLLAAVDIPDDLTAQPATVVSVPVNIDTSIGVRGAEIRLRYDTALLDLTVADVTAGTVWAGASDTQVTANVNDANGTVVVFISASAVLPAGAGSLVQFRFTVAAGATAGATTALDLTEVTLNEDQVDVTPAPIPGNDPTDGLLTIAADNGGGVANRIGGFVYADTNLNNTPEAVEGIPGVIITLANTTTGITQQATTTANGSYEFLNLVAGTYTVTETQPIAYLEGGVNSLTVSLASGQVLADQNFRELGLLPQFIYNRLLTTTVLPVGSTPWTNEILRINQDAASGTIAPAPAPTSSVTTAPIAALARSIAITNVPLASTPSVVSQPVATLAFDAAPDPDDETNFNVVDEAIAALEYLAN